MNGYVIIVIGLILVGVGGFLGFYGAQLNNRADNAKTSETFNTHIDKVLNAIASAKESASVGTSTQAAPGESQNPAEAQKKLANIERDFSRWASDFIKARDLKKSEVERTKLEARNKELEVSKAYRKIFQSAIEVLRGAVTAYNATANATFAVQLPDLPMNLYDVPDRPWVIGTIKFNKGTEWRVRLWAERPADVSRLPFLEVVIEDAGFSNPGPDVVQISLSPPDYTVRGHGGGIVTAVKLDSREPLDSYEQTLPTHLQQLLETQIASLPRK